MLAGFTLHPDDEFLARTASIARTADYLEVAPETTWIEREDGALVPNGFHARFAAAARAWNRPLVAHGVGFSMASDESDDARTARWLARMRADRDVLGYAWWTDHLGATSLAGEALTHPMPMPMDPRTARVIASRLDRMATIVPDVGVENTVVHFVLGDPMDEPAFLSRVLGRERWLLLDLHNVVTMATNLGFDPRAWLARCDLSRVIEIHVSGGSESDPRWLASGRTVRLDGHDGPVPELVWTLLDEVLPRCTHARGVTLERMEGTVTSDADARDLAAEFARLREAIARAA